MTGHTRRLRKDARTMKDRAVRRPVTRAREQIDRGHLFSSQAGGGQRARCRVRLTCVVQPRNGAKRAWNGQRDSQQVCEQVVAAAVQLVC
jgi:hypothetical protein